jgi:hypothetical protein
MGKKAIEEAYAEPREIELSTQMPIPKQELDRRYNKDHSVGK